MSICAGFSGGFSGVAECHPGPVADGIAAS